MYTPRAALSDEIYNFLHRLPQLGRIVIFADGGHSPIPEIDHSNLRAMLDESHSQKRSAPFMEREDMGPFVKDWKRSAPVNALLALDRFLNKHEVKLPPQLPRVVIAVTARHILPAR